jgi:hypothetical protein
MFPHWRLVEKSAIGLLGWNMSHYHPVALYWLLRNSGHRGELYTFVPRLLLLEREQDNYHLMDSITIGVDDRS